MKRLYLLTALFIALSHQLFAQVIPKDIIERVTKSEFIFEGEVIRENGYWNDNENFIYTSLTIDVKKLFKGTLLCGKIEMILDGGKVGDSIALEISHNLVLKKGDKGIFLCRRTAKELPAIDYYPENNPEKLEAIFNEQGFLKYFKDGINPVISDWQFSLDSLAKVYDLMELYTQLNYVDCYPAQSIFDNELVQNEEPPTASNSDYRSSSVNAIDTNLTSTLENPQLTTFGGRKYFEFDISLSDSAAGIYLNQAIVKIKYDTLTFGSRIKFNNKITLSRGTVLLDTTTYRNPSGLDFTNEIITIVIGNTHDSLISFYDLSSTPTPTVHVKIEIMDCNHVSAIEQFQFNTFAFYTLGATTALPIFSYDTLNTPNNLNFSGCGGGIVYINSILPSNVRAGTGDLVTINGGGFGSTRGSGNVFLKNADDGGRTYLQLDSMDYITWNNNEISFIVPSAIGAQKHCPGSGLVKIMNDAGDSISSPMDYINIDYSVKNIYVHDSIFNKFFVNLSPDDTSAINGGFIFRPDTSFTSHPDRLATFKKAVDSWVCLTTVNFNVGDEIDTSTDSIAVLDGISRVKFAYISDSSTIANTQQWVYYRRGNCNSAWTKEIDIIFNKDFLFVADTNINNNIPVGYIDLYQVALHELGHALSLHHVNDQSKVMWYASLPFGIAAADRRVTLYNDQAAIDGGLYVVNESLLFDTVNCAAGTNILTSGNSHCTIDISEIDRKINNLNLYPNPTSSDLNISFQTDKPSALSIQIIDLTGRVIYSSVDKITTLSYNATIPISQSIDSGIYILKLNIGMSEYNGKFIKQKL